MLRSTLLLVLLWVAKSWARPASCDIDGIRIDHGSVKYLLGQPHRPGSIYARCLYGAATCFEDRGLVDAPHWINSQEVNCFHASERRRLGVAINLKEDIWPDHVVWYRINGTFSDDELEIIHMAVDLYTKADVNVTLQECEPVSKCNGKYASIEQNEDACYSMVGYVDDGKPQVINLGQSCFDGGPGKAVHEIGHTLGLFHEHTHPDRQVIILTDQNLPVSAENYAKATDTEATLKPYDPKSIMHYGRTAGLCFPKAQYPLKLFCDVERIKNCVQPVKQHCNSSRDSEIGSRAVLSAGDILTLRALYGPHTDAKVRDIEIPTLASLTTTYNDAPDTLTDMMKHTTQTSTPTKAAPTKGVPTKAAPPKAVPTKAAPPKAAPPKAAPMKGVPTKGAPTKGAPPKAVPTKAVPTKAVPTKAVPTKAVPTKAVPTKAFPTKAVPPKAVPTKAAPPIAAPPKAAPTKGAPTKGAPPKGALPKGAPPKAVPTKAVPTKAVPTKAVPTKGVPTKGAPTKGAPIKAVPTKAVPTKAVPPKAIPHKGAPPKAVPTKEVPTKGAPPKAVPTKGVKQTTAYNPGGVHGEKTVGGSGSVTELLEWWENLENTAQVQQKTPKRFLTAEDA